MTIPSVYIGLMSGTSLDGVDGVVASIGDDDDAPITSLASAYVPFPESLKAELMALQRCSENELHREAMAGNAIAALYADCTERLLAAAKIDRTGVAGIGAHGQTIRHRPECGFTRQTNNPALLAELTGIDVIADFRSRDIAAGGQGAPLVPAFHQAVFGSAAEARVVVNIGGIANLSILQPGAASLVGFDTGPGNVLMDLWVHRHRNAPYDEGGMWAASGKVSEPLLEAMRSDPYFALPPPKSTGRDLFHADWLDRMLRHFSGVQPNDVQATLCALTSTSIADAIKQFAPGAAGIYVCGGGALNDALMASLAENLRQGGMTASVQSTESLGVMANQVEALAFAWLAHRFCSRKPGNLASVTGARGPRLLGALYPA
ncbi:MAG: anhydro-N-acetylmuramic acid kinase [Herminiimonas sp.]|nr:anhydro-N-acetylmuramic acid kinase [Herminiimonas sp.]